ncbi:MAG: ribosome-associated translation inhibitor RaiA [Patescibacteria group bacterium]
MKITFLTKNIKLTTPLKKFVEQKIGGLEHICRDIMETWVELDEDTSQQSGEKKYRVEVQIKLKGGSLRAEETSGDILISINEIIPKLKKQIEKFKTRFRNVRKNA